MAQRNKSLAQMSKSGNGVNATKGYGLMMWEREECVSSNASPTRRAKRAEFDPLCYLGPILTRLPA